MQITGSFVALRKARFLTAEELCIESFFCVCVQATGTYSSGVIFICFVFIPFHAPITIHR